ncbi:MAG TPA: FxLYD domain-containing protein [Candidatus Acidoferrales bacterium]|nr:FxLYD domain-containing protein [Candidatus Acidoferrales bacterium]
MEDEQKHGFAGPFLAGVVIMVILFAAFYLALSHSEQPSPVAQKPLAFGAAEQAYVVQIKFNNLNMSAYENMFHQKVTYLNGDIANTGPRTIRAADVTIEFYDAANNVVLRDTRRIIGGSIRPLAAGETQGIQIGFESIPATWNGQFPAMRVSGLDLE